jgi:hypothetical protein
MGIAYFSEVLGGRYLVFNSYFFHATYLYCNFYKWQF